MKIKLLLLQIIQNGIVPNKCCGKELRAPFIKVQFIEIYIRIILEIQASIKYENNYS